MRRAKELTPSSPILRNQKIFSPNCALGSLHLRPVLLISLVFPSPETRTLMFLVQLKFGEFCTVVSLLAQPFPHDRWPCDHSHVVLVESLALLHMRESPHLGVISCSVHFRIFKLIRRKSRSLMKPTRNEMEYAVGPFRSQHVAPV